MEVSRETMYTLSFKVYSDLTSLVPTYQVLPGMDFLQAWIWYSNTNHLRLLFFLSFYLPSPPPFLTLSGRIEWFESIFNTVEILKKRKSHQY